MTFDSRVKARRRRIGRKISYFLVPVIFSVIIMGIITAVSFFAYNSGKDYMKKITASSASEVSASAEIPMFNLSEGYEWH